MHYRTQPAILLAQFARAADTPGIGDEMLRHADTSARRALLYVGATVLVVDPFDQRHRRDVAAALRVSRLRAGGTWQPPATSAVAHPSAVVGAVIPSDRARTEHSTERYFEAFEQGRLSPERCEQRVARLNARLDDLRAQQAELADDGAEETAHTPTAADLAATADRLERVIAQGEPGQAKALLRILIAELRVNSKTDIRPTYRVITPDRTHTAGVCATSEKVETAGLRGCEQPGVSAYQPLVRSALRTLTSSADHAVLD